MLLTLRMILAVTGMPAPYPEGTRVTSRVDCVSRCYHITWCSSMFYDKTTQMCYLLNTVYDELELGRFAVAQNKTYMIWGTGQCPGGYTWIRALNLCFKTYQKTKTWIESEAVCRQDGGHLLKVRSAEANTLFNRIGRYTNQTYWLGGTDTDEEGTWLWSDGSPILSTFWSLGQPNNVGDSGQDCLIIARWDIYTNRWHDDSCSKHFAFICEILLLD